MTNVSDIQNTLGLGVGPARQTPDTLEEAAAQFEEILARQLVQTMTKGLFESSLSGEDGPQWMSGQRDTQRDMLTDVLAKHLSDDGTLRLRDLLLRQWQAGEATTSERPVRGGMPLDDGPGSTSDEVVDGDVTRPPDATQHGTP